MQQQPTEFLSPEKLQLFVAGLSGLAPEEIRKAKLLYLRNAISGKNGVCLHIVSAVLRAVARHCRCRGLSYVTRITLAHALQPPRFDINEADSISLPTEYEISP